MLNPSQGAALGAKRPPLAESLLQLASKVEQRANDVAAAAVKLECIATQTIKTDAKQQGVPTASYPPLFQQLVDILIRIDNALAHVEDVIQRTEV